MIYPKEFVLLCSDWLRGSIQDKSMFTEYLPLMKKNSFKTNGYRIWEFDEEELGQLIFQEGDISIDSNPIESCFSQLHNEPMFSSKRQEIDVFEIESINRLLCMWSSNVKIITRWENTDYFNIYEPIKEALSRDRLNYSKEELELLTKRYEHYSHQHEILHLGEYDNISSGEVLYVLLNKDYFEYLFEDELLDLVYGEMNEYLVFYNDEKFRETFVELSIYDNFLPIFNFNYAS